MRWMRAKSRRLAADRNPGKWNGQGRSHGFQTHKHHHVQNRIQIIALSLRAVAPDADYFCPSSYNSPSIFPSVSLVIINNNGQQ